MAREETLLWVLMGLAAVSLCVAAFGLWRVARLQRREEDRDG